jgi:prepilin-type N-terminal cleavage/methylation domain-containing protein
MRFHSHHLRRARAFTLVELLVVVAIMALLVAVGTVSLQGISSSGKFDKALTEISGILEQGRAYAVAQDTYVWVVFYENVPASGPREVFVGAFASNDGTDPFNWAGTVTMPSPGTFGSTTLSAVTRLYSFRGLHLQTTSMPDAPTAPSIPSLPASTPVFQVTGRDDSGPVTLSGSSPVYWVIQFTPTGAAHNGPNPIDSIWLGLEPSVSQAVTNSPNVASLKVNGLTGLTTIYRPQ